MSPQPINTIPPLTAIAAAQATTPLFAFDRAEVHRVLPRLQRIYAVKLAQYEAMAALFDEADPDIVLQVPSHQLTLRLPAAVSGVYTELRKAFDEELRGLESEIIKAHLDIEQSDQYWASRPAPKPDDSEYYVSRIIALCQPASAIPTNSLLISCQSLSREELTQREAAAHARAEAEATLEQPDSPGERHAAARAIGAQYLWHVDFPDHFPQQLTCLDLFRLTAELPDLLRELNGGKELDAHDFGYVADVLRGALAKQPTADLRLLQERALAWVEHAGAALLNPPFPYSAAA